MSPAQEFSRWYLDPEVGFIYTTIDLNTILVPKFNVEVVRNNMKLHRDVSTLSESVLEKNPSYFLIMIMTRERMKSEEEMQYNMMLYMLLKVKEKYNYKNK